MSQDIRQYMQEPRQRKRYEKPRLKSLPLVADEVLAKGCKTVSPGPGFQGTGCVSGGCNQSGS